jgi:hypothetical protein
MQYLLTVPKDFSLENNTYAYKTMENDIDASKQTMENDIDASKQVKLIFHVKKITNLQHCLNNIVYY